MSDLALTVLFITNRGLNPLTGTARGTYDLLADALAAQTLPPDRYEVICVDRSNPLPRPELRRVPGLQARCCRPRPTPWTARGLFAAAAARNTGLTLARGATVLALDDCYDLSPQALERVVARAAAGDYVVPLLRYAAGEVRSFRAPFAAGDHPGGIVSYPLAAAVAVNGYDERYDGAAAYEDVDFTTRLERAGVHWARDDEVVATGYLHAPRRAQPKCALLVWLLSEERRRRGGPDALRGNVPWTPAELDAFATCGRERRPPRCWRTVRTDPRVGEYGGQCDYDEDLVFDPEHETEAARAVRVGYQQEPAVVRLIRTTYETRPWLDLAAERERAARNAATARMT